MTWPLFLILAWPLGMLANGLADALPAFIGLTVGFPQGLRALSWGVLLAGAFSLGLLLSRRGTLKTAFPYGPFLALGGAAALLGF